MPVSPYDSRRRGIVCAFPSIPRRESAQSKVLAFETPVESLIKIMENAEIARRLDVARKPHTAKEDGKY